MFTEQIEPIDILTESRLPLQERVVDKLADMLFASDMILDMLSTERELAPEYVAAVEVAVKNVYDQVNELMARLTD